MLTSHKVFTEAELESRCEIMLENYCKTVAIEANTMVDMAKKQIAPAVEEYTSKIAATAASKKEICGDAACEYEKGVICRLSQVVSQIAERTDALESAIVKIDGFGDIKDESYYIRDTILPAMRELRLAADEAEGLVGEKYWPFPTYGDLLFGVR